MKITCTNEQVLILYIDGRIDSNNADLFEAEIEEGRKQYSGDYKELVLDVENMEYISSAGLRVILRLRKQEPDLKIVNVNPEVYEIFEMTGFSEMISIEKAYRKISIEGCEIIGQGANGTIYSIDADTIVKVYKSPDCLPDIHRERELARKAFVMGIPTPIPYDVVKVGDTYGTVFELLSAKSLAKLIKADPENVEHYAEISVDILKIMHGTEIEAGFLPDKKEECLTEIEHIKNFLSDDCYKKLCQLVLDIPEDHHMMHGDFHIKNVMMQNGEVLLIDMDTLCTGHPIFEMASIYNAYVGFSEYDPGNVSAFLGITEESAARFWKRTKELYYQTTDEEKLQDIEEKMRVVAYIGMVHWFACSGGKDSDMAEKMIQGYAGSLEKLVKKMDRLV